MTPEQINITEMISRYKSWITNNIPHNPYYKSKWEWENEVKEKIKELEQKINPNLCKNLIGD